MANKKLTDLTELTTPADGDFLYIVDVSDTTESAQGTSKKIRKSNITPVISGKEDISNKQNSLAVDGTGTKYPTVDAVNTIDLQKVVDVGGYAEKNTSYINFLAEEDGEITSDFRVYSEDLSKNSKVGLSGGVVEVANSNGLYTGFLNISDGIINIQETNETTGNITTFGFAPPVVSSSIKLPAKTVAGDYTLATTDDIPTLKQVMEQDLNDNTASGSITLYQPSLSSTEYSSESILTTEPTVGRKTSISYADGSITSADLQFSFPSSKADGNYIIATKDDVDAKITQTITNGVTDKSPSEDAVYDAINGVIKTIISDTPTSTNTGGVSEVLMHPYTIAGGKLPTICNPNLKIRVSKSGTLGTYTLRVKVNSTNNFSTATTIATYSGAANTNAYLLTRNPILIGGNMDLPVSGTASSITDETVFATAFPSITYDPSVTQYWFISLQNSDSTDTTRIRSIKLVN